MPKTRNFRHDYYTVAIPGDLADNIEDLGQQAIREAEERSKLYALPAVWTATRIKGEPGDHEVTFRVCRKRHNTALTPA